MRGLLKRHRRCAAMRRYAHREPLARRQRHRAIDRRPSWHQRHTSVFHAADCSPAATAPPDIACALRRSTSFSPTATRTLQKQHVRSETNVAGGKALFELGYVAGVVRDYAALLCVKTTRGLVPTPSLPRALGTPSGATRGRCGPSFETPVWHFLRRVTRFGRPH